MFAYTNNYSVEHLLKLLRASYTIPPLLTSFKENQVPTWEIDT